MGDYYQVTPGWPEARILWYNALRGIAQGNDIRASLTDCTAKANKAAKMSKYQATKTRK